jgi:hypothetical protein
VGSTKLSDIAFAAITPQKGESVNQKLWLDPVEVAPIIGESVYSICRDIRLGQFPFRVERIGRRYKISARSLGLITDKQEEQPQGEVYQDAA